MALTVPTAGRVREVLDYDDEIGQLRWRIRRGSVQPGTIAGCVSSRGYRVLRVDNVLAGAHRYVWLHVHGEWPDRSLDIDHINGLRDDNHVANLRVVNRKLNNWNVVEPTRRNSSGFRGVSWDKRAKRWEAAISINNRKHFLGYYGTAEEASAAYWRMKADLHGDAYAGRL